MKQRTIFRILSPTIGLLMCWAISEGLFLPQIYAGEPENPGALPIGQDLINLSLILPFYLFAVSFRQERRWYFPLLWAGAALYFIYTYLIYCFDIHFNRLFVFYCLILCFHFYWLLYLMSLYLRVPLFVRTSAGLRKGTGSYFIGVAMLFYYLWLAGIIPSSPHSTVPGSGGLFANPVEVLDSLFVLPGIMIVGILLLRNSALGSFLAPVVLTFLLLMELTFGGLILLFRQKGAEGHPEVALFLFALAVINLVLLFRHIKRTTVTV